LFYLLFVGKRSPGQDAINARHQISQKPVLTDGLFAFLSVHNLA
jgi:hypothetical protein